MAKWRINKYYPIHTRDKNVNVRRKKGRYREIIERFDMGTGLFLFIVVEYVLVNKEDQYKSIKL